MEHCISALARAGKILGLKVWWQLCLIHGDGNWAKLKCPLVQIALIPIASYQRTPAIESMKPINNGSKNNQPKIKPTN